MPVLVKICGLTRSADVDAAVRAGADMTGFILYDRSPRYVDLERLHALAERVPDHVLKVGVVVNATPEFISRVVDAGKLDVIQFHGDEPEDVISAHTLTPSWKAMGVENQTDVERAVGNPAHCILLDATSRDARGGTGRRCNWDLAAQVSKRRSIVLAGGLNPATVREAIRKVHPFAVDVSSGVETAPGIKDHDAIRAFVANVKAYAPGENSGIAASTRTHGDQS